MLITSTDFLSFGYRHPLKTLWKQGKFPSVKRGLYGGILTKDTVTLEHIQPRSKGGASNLNNYALATKINNNRRSNEDIRDFLTPSQVDEYCKQFEGIKIRDFNGKKYVEAIKKTFRRLGVDV